MNLLKLTPNALTLSRLLVIPLIVTCISFNSAMWSKIASWLFLYACATDALDGMIARAYKAKSALGTCLDPIADKVLVGSVMTMLVWQHKTPLFPAIAIMSREILVSGLREFLAQVKVSVPVTHLAKFKTVIQMTALYMLVLGESASGIESIERMGSFLLWLATALTLITGYVYVQASWKVFSKKGIDGQV